MLEALRPTLLHRVLFPLPHAFSLSFSSAAADSSGGVCLTFFVSAAKRSFIRSASLFLASIHRSRREALSVLRSWI